MEVGRKGGLKRAEDEKMICFRHDERAITAPIDDLAILERFFSDSGESCSGGKGGKRANVFMRFDYLLLGINETAVTENLGIPLR